MNYDAVAGNALDELCSFFYLRAYMVLPHSDFYHGIIRNINSSQLQKNCYIVFDAVFSAVDRTHKCTEEYPPNFVSGA
jgi:hypothetical protein